MISGDAICGSRIGAGPMGEPERGAAAPRIRVSFWCVNRHETRPSFSADAAIPETWECPRCGNLAGQDERNPPARPQAEPYKSHLAYVKERRSAADGEAILAEALARLHGTTSTRPYPPTPRPTSRADGRRQVDDPDDQEPRRSADRRGSDRRSPAAARGDRPRPSRRQGETTRTGGGDQDLAPGPARGRVRRAELPAPAPAQAAPRQAGPRRSAAGSGRAARRPARSGPALSGPSAEERCGGCGYLPDSPSHLGMCLGQWPTPATPPR